MSAPFIAEIRMWGCSFAPRGWAFCDGQILPIAQNTALFSLVGTTYGGDGRSTLGLPNLQAKIPMHPGRGPGLTARRLGQHFGTETETLLEAQIPPHTHQLHGSKPSGGEKIPDYSEPAPDRMLAGLMEAQERTQANAYVTEPDPSQRTPMAEGALADFGNSQAHENRQPFLTLNFCIATIGLYPSRN